ncbi:ABC transporter ATP-binding protein [Bacteroidota bacterium]|nr:ABC transporter ATP-binding protein [Bacteroidota bacterium]
MSNIVELKNIRKVYLKTAAVDDVSFIVPEKSIFGMLGPNGSGKTTTIRMITSIIMPDSGQVLFGNELLKRNHTALMGYMPEERGLYKKMKVWEQLVYLAQLKGLSAKDAKKKVFEWMDRLNIKDWWNKKVEELSKGMGQKIQFVSTVVHEPKLIILDEPFSGLDPVNADLIKNEIMRLRDEGATIIFSTHRMEQVEEICESIVLYNKGKVILDGKVDEVRRRFRQHNFSVKYEGVTPTMSDFRFKVQSTNDHEMIVKIADDAQPKDLLRTLINQDCNVISFNEILPSLNEIFIQQVTTTQ